MQGFKEPLLTSDPTEGGQNARRWKIAAMVATGCTAFVVIWTTVVAIDRNSYVATSQAQALELTQMQQELARLRSHAQDLERAQKQEEDARLRSQAQALELAQLQQELTQLKSQPPAVAREDATVSAAAAAPQWYEGIDSVKVFEPGDDVEKVAWELYNCTTATAEFSPNRHALLLKSGTYSDQIAVGYYTSLIGVGASADDVEIQSFYTLNKCCNDVCGDALTNFWRSAEGVSTKGDVTWAASQAAPLRRLHVRGSLTLSHKAPVSGGYVADSVIDRHLDMGMQQQHLVRNCEVSEGVVGEYMNYVYLGVNGAPAPKQNGRRSVLDTTPRVAAKPFLVEEGGEWFIVLPPKVEGTRGPLNLKGTRVPMADVFVARAGDDAGSINAGIVGKRALLLTPAVYSLGAPITIFTEGFVVLGIGFPTLVATAGRSALLVAATGVRVSGVLVEAGTSVDAAHTEPLVLWAGSHGVGSDIFSRVGAFKYATASKPSCLRTRAEVHMAIDGDDVTLDNTWLWHADHDDCQGLSDSSFSGHGLVVNGARTLALGLQVEHMMDDLVLWRGEGGTVYFFQAELPYKYANFSSVGYHVEPHVKEHTLVGAGVYAIGNLYSVPVGIRLPATANAKNLFFWAISASHSQFSNVVCTGPKTSAVCYGGDLCDYVSCYQLALPQPSR